MITDEMMRVATRAYIETKGDKYVCGEAMFNAISALIPLIRDQVLEDVASLCDEMAVNANANGYGEKSEPCMDSAVAIRDMKGNKDA
jgi:hypothetical protein